MYLPAQKQTAAEIALASGMSEQSVIDKLGLVEKTIPGAEDHSNAMGLKAAEIALKRAGVKPSEVDLLISITEEHKEYPVWLSGAQAAAQLGCINAYAYDLGQKCGATVMALKQAQDALRADPYLDTVLICGGYRNGDLVDYQNPKTRFLNNLAAGGGALVVQRGGRGYQLLGSGFITDGSQANNVIVSVGGTQEPIDLQNQHRFHFDVQDFSALQQWLGACSLNYFEQVIRQACARSDRLWSDIGYLGLPHIKRSAHHALLQQLKLPEAVRTIYLEHYGHVGQIDTVLFLELLEQPHENSGGFGILASAGVGYVWNAMGVQWVNS